MSFRRNAVRASVAAGLVALAAAVAPAASRAADVDPLEKCTAGIGYNAAVPTWEQWFAAHPEPRAVTPFAAGTATSGGGAPTNGTGTPPIGRNLTAVIYEYWDGLVGVTASDAKNPDGTWVYPYQVIRKPIGVSTNGRPINFYVVSTRENIAALDAGRNDAGFWRGVREGTISTDEGLEAAGTRPAFAWITATPHGGESAAGESITRNVYELLARTDCENVTRMQKLDLFMMPVRNPDGRDAVTRTTAWGFDPNRDFGTQNQPENGLAVPLMNEYPGVFFIDAHQQGGRAYFFPPNEDPVHHEISSFSLDFIQDIIGPGLQNAFNDQSDYYTNYSQYDLFTPEYGDTVPSLIMGAAGMTYEKGTANIYSRQVYDHYLAIDTTINVTANSKYMVTSAWVKQWGEAIQQGEDCEYQKNSLVSPLHDHIEQQPPLIEDAPAGQPKGGPCGYFFKPNQHTGDVSALIQLLQKTGVRVWRLDQPVAVNGYHEYGKTDGSGTLPAGTLWIPLTQGTKHWINALLEENPWIPYSYFYDVVTWSYPLQRGMGGSGFLTAKMSPGVAMTEVNNPELGTVTGAGSPVYAFNTDSMRGLGLAIDLLDKGVNVYRAKTGFTAGGTQYFSGAALVDGASLAASGADINGLAAARDTPVVGLPNYPAAHFQMRVPKIGLYTGSGSIPSYPFNRTGTADGHCGVGGNSSFCQAMFTLAVKDNIPRSRIIAVTSTDLANGKLVADKYTAFINPGGNITTGTSTDPNNPCPTFTPNITGLGLRDFVNAGGIYIGTLGGGYSTARCLLMAPNVGTVDTQGGRLLTPGSMFDGDFETSNPVAWGFDLGSWIYRESNGDPIYDTLQLNGTQGKAVVSYSASVASNPGHYGYQLNAAGLAGRPAVIDTPTGSGHAVIMGFDPFYRAWRESDERLVLNAALYPIGTEAPSTEPSAVTAEPAPASVAPAAAPLAEKKLVKTVSRAKSRTAKKVTNDVLIRVKRADGAKLKAAVKTAKLSKAIRKKVSYKTTRTSVTLVVKGARTSNEHTRRAWVSRIQNALIKSKVRAIDALL